jgi:NAD(P)-dependent dehydrogenase (short-subunit alcohol dehydrogenase family)
LFHYHRKYGCVDRFSSRRYENFNVIAMLTRHQGNWEYTCSKYGLRGFMRTARRNSWEQGIRINYVAPCWIKSAIRSVEYEKWLLENGIEFGEQADCAGCMIRIAADKSINGESFDVGRGVYECSKGSN